jgi:hypothetical protein
MALKDNKGRHRLGATIENVENSKVIRDENVAKEKRAPKERVTFQLPVELIEKARDVVYFTPGFTMTRLMEEALVATLEKMARKRGGQFESRGNARLRTGRPVKKFSGN